MLLSAPCERDLNPLPVLIHISSWSLDRKPARERGICLQESIDGCVVAGRHPPVAVFANQILLHDELAIGVEWFVDMSEHRGVRDCEIAGHADRSNLNPLKLIQIACALQASDEAVPRNSISRR